MFGVCGPVDDVLTRRSTLGETERALRLRFCRRQKTLVRRRRTSPTPEAGLDVRDRSLASPWLYARPRPAGRRGGIENDRRCSERESERRRAQIGSERALRPGSRASRWQSRGARGVKKREETHCRRLNEPASASCQSPICERSNEGPSPVTRFDLAEDTQTTRETEEPRPASVRS